MPSVSSPETTVYCDHSEDTAHAWALGYALGLHSEVSEPPAGFTEAEADAFRSGWTCGESHRRLTRGWPDVLRPADELGEWLAERHGDDHDGQFCPLDIEYWAMSEFEYYDAERELEEMWHDAEIERVLGHRFADRGDDE